MTLSQLGDSCNYRDNFCWNNPFCVKSFSLEFWNITLYWSIIEDTSRADKPSEANPGSEWEDARWGSLYGPLVQWISTQFRILEELNFFSTAFPITKKITNGGGGGGERHWRFCLSKLRRWFHLQGWLLLKEKLLCKVNETDLSDSSCVVLTNTQGREVGSLILFLWKPWINIWDLEWVRFLGKT